jgi:hypothetical protein
MPSTTAFDFPEPMHQLVATVSAPASALSDHDGQIRPTGVQGLYVSDARVLHGAQIAIDDLPIVGIGWESVGPFTTVFHGVVPGLGDLSPDPTVRIERTRTLRADGLDETIRVRSTAVTPVRATVAMALVADMTSLPVARAGRTSTKVCAALDGDSLTWSDDDATVRMTATGAALDADAMLVQWPLDLHRGDAVTLRWSISVADLASPLVAAGAPPTWIRPAPVSADPRLGRLVDRALDDLTAMRMAEAASPRDTFIAAGVPWFLTLFGRDSIWAARMLLPLGTDLAETTLRALARRQGVRVDVESGEQPGKIMHELRRDRIWPGVNQDAGPAVYYGTIDATLLWISLLADAWRDGMDSDVVAGFLPYLIKALGWLTDYGDPTGGSFVSYHDRTGLGIANQGWKDSSTAVLFRDGTRSAPPIALCEVQGYAHRAALDGADILDSFGASPEVSERCRSYAEALATRFREQFWVDSPIGPHPALALDRDGRAVDSLTSNIGHLLGTGLLSDTEEVTVARRLGDPALAGGYGLRTMSDLDAGFDPMSYHCGSIWPHDTAIALLGLTTMPQHAEARATAATLMAGLLAAAEVFDYRLPELFSGDSRSDTGRPLPHPAACRPQAWSAAAAIAILQVARLNAAAIA